MSCFIISMLKESSTYKIVKFIQHVVIDHPLASRYCPKWGYKDEYNSHCSHKASIVAGRETDNKYTNK